MLRKLAIVSSVVLVGGFVALKSVGCRDGDGTTMMPSTKRGHIVDEPKGETTLMPGSKSSAPFTSNGRLDTTVPATRRAVMSGSKSMSPVIEVPAAAADSASSTQPTTNPSK